MKETIIKTVPIGNYGEVSIDGVWSLDDTFTENRRGESHTYAVLTQVRKKND